MKSSTSLKNLAFLSALVGLLNLWPSLPAQGAVFDDAVAHWKLDFADSGAVNASDVTDSRPTPLNGTAIVGSGGAGLVWTTASGNRESTDQRGILFDEQHSVQLGTAGVANKVHAVSGDMTVYARLKLDTYADDNSGNNFRLFNNFLWNGGNSQGFAVSIMGVISTVPGRALWTTGTGTGYDQQDLGPTGFVPTNQWINLFYILDPSAVGQEMKVIVGTPGNLATATKASANPMVAWTMTYDAQVLGGARSFPGTLDTLAIWDRVLTPAEIEALNAIPEPAAGLLALCGVGIVCWRVRRKQGR